MSINNEQVKSNSNSEIQSASVFNAQVSKWSVPNHPILHCGTTAKLHLQQSNLSKYLHYKSMAMASMIKIRNHCFVSTTFASKNNSIPSSNPAANHSFNQCPHSNIAYQQV
jgi:hypothetical protein